MELDIQLIRDFPVRESYGFHQCEKSELKSVDFLYQACEYYSSSSVAGNEIDVIHAGRIVRVRCNIDLDCVLEEKLPGALKRCPSTCIGPVKEDLGVSTADELDIFTFMECELALGSGVLVDARTPDLHAKGTIPGSINIPYTVLHLNSKAPELVQALQMLGAKQKGRADIEDSDASVTQPPSNSIWDFSTAKDIVLWCNGPMGQQSPMAINGLRNLGYPLEKITHYRGGMQLWQVFDLTTVVPD